MAKLSVHKLAGIVAGRKASARHQRRKREKIAKKEALVDLTDEVLRAAKLKPK